MTGDDTHSVRRFFFLTAPIRGTWVRLYPSADCLFGWDEQPPEAADLLAQMLAATAMVADGLKFDGAVSLQIRGDGRLRHVMAECRDRTLLRGVAKCEPAPRAGTPMDFQSLLGRGHLSLNLLPDKGQMYQGLVALQGETLSAGLSRYFSESEQLPTFLRLVSSTDRVTGLLLQRLPEADSLTDRSPADLWQEAELLAGTCTDEELSQLAPDVLLRRLFASHTLRLHEPRPLEFRCSCSSERSDNAMRLVPRDELLEQVATDGVIQVTCEFCGRIYQYDRMDVHLLFEREPPEIH